MTLILLEPYFTIYAINLYVFIYHTSFCAMMSQAHDLHCVFCVK